MNTLQETFDIVALHLHDQGRRAISEDSGSCAYLVEDGGRCAVGCLIPDDTGAAFEGDVYGLLEVYPELIEVIVPHDEGYDKGRSLLSELQQVHDYALNWNEYYGNAPGLASSGYRKLRDVAADFDLDSSLIDILEPA